MYLTNWRRPGGFKLTGTSAGPGLWSGSARSYRECVPSYHISDAGTPWPERWGRALSDWVDPGPGRMRPSSIAGTGGTEQRPVRTGRKVKMKQFIHLTTYGKIERVIGFPHGTKFRRMVQAGTIRYRNC